MKKTICLLLLAAAVLSAAAQQLTILHTNDTHSQIDPVDKDNRGGVARRLVAIDSVRLAEPNVLLVDAGDAVQGTLFFNLYGGEVEQRLMNLMGYDLRILGNHEFDNGMESLASMLALSNAKKISTNYDLRGTALDSLFATTHIERVGDKRVGFIGINIDPFGIISDENWLGVVYNDAIASANTAARLMRDKDSVDMVVALTHIGYDPEGAVSDRNLAARSRDIDVIIGGHSHDRLDPADSAATHVANLDGRPVLVVQTGKAGKDLGKVDLDLAEGTADYSLIPIDARLDARTDGRVESLLEPYRRGVDSLMREPVAKNRMELDNAGMPLLNFASDFILDRGRELDPAVELGIINKGGLRCSLPKGVVTEGKIMSMLPFDNRVVVLDVPGSDLRRVFDVMAGQGGNGVSGNVSAKIATDGRSCSEIIINGRPLDDERTYRVATIDYLAKGGDYMDGFRGHEWLARSKQSLATDLISYLRGGHPFTYDKTRRMN